MILRQLLGLAINLVENMQRRLIEYGMMVGVRACVEFPYYRRVISLIYFPNKHETIKLILQCENMPNRKDEENEKGSLSRD